MAMQKRNGFSLIELTVSVGLLSIVVLGVRQLMITSLQAEQRVSGRGAALDASVEIIARLKADFKNATKITYGKWGIIDQLIFEGVDRQFIPFYGNQWGVGWMTNAFKNQVHSGWLHSFMAGYNQRTYAPNAMDASPKCLAQTYEWPVLSRTKLVTGPSNTPLFTDSHAWPSGGGTWAKLLTSKTGDSPIKPEKGGVVGATMCIDFTGSNAIPLSSTSWEFDNQTAIINGVIVVWYATKKGTAEEPPKFSSLVVPFSLTKTQTLSDIRYND